MRLDVDTKKIVIFYLIAKEAKRKRKERKKEIGQSRCIEGGQREWQKLSRNISTLHGFQHLVASLCLVFLFVGDDPLPKSIESNGLISRGVGLTLSLAML